MDESYVLFPFLVPCRTFENLVVKRRNLMNQGRRKSVGGEDGRELML